MVPIKVQAIGDDLGVVFDADTVRELDLKAGDTIMVEPSPIDVRERGKAFVNRYIKTFEALAK